MEIKMRRLIGKLIWVLVGLGGVFALLGCTGDARNDEPLPDIQGPALILFYTDG